MRHVRWRGGTMVAVVCGAAAVFVAAIALTPAGHEAQILNGDQVPRADAATLVDTTVGRLVAGMPPDSVSIAAQNLSRSQNYRHDSKTRITTASVIKLDILETLLLQRQDDGEQLSDTETAQATAMIENSDNDAATALWNDVGGADGLRAAGSRLGAAHTEPDDDGYWGLTTTDADDQLDLLRDLVTPGPLTLDSQAFALNLMRQVQLDQAWGVGTIADPGSATALKDGWLAVDDDNGLWAVGSVGIVTVHGQQVLLAVLTQHDGTENDGIGLTESLARAVAPVIAG